MESLGSSSQEQELLRPIATWAATFAAQALTVFESRHPEDLRPRTAIKIAQEFGNGMQRDKNMRMVAFAAMKAGKNTDEPSKYASRAAMLAAAVAYMHTDLQTGDQGVRQAQHILGPIVYTALAVETATNNPERGIELLHTATASAPPQVGHILKHMPPQPNKPGRVSELFRALDILVRNS